MIAGRDMFGELSMWLARSRDREDTVSLTGTAHIDGAGRRLERIFHLQLATSDSNSPRHILATVDDY